MELINIEVSMSFHSRVRTEVLRLMERRDLARLCNLMILKGLHLEDELSEIMAIMAFIVHLFLLMGLVSSVKAEKLQVVVPISMAY